jgi:DNA-binding transcriptional MerR regulator
MVRPTPRTSDLTLTDDLLTIGEMCAEFQVTPRALRFYEAKELLAPIRSGQKRLYTKRCRARLKLILQGKRFGFSLEDIRQLLDLYAIGDQQTTQIARTYELAVERLRTMEQQRSELDVAIADLRRQMQWSEELLASRGLGKAAE